MMIKLIFAMGPKGEFGLDEGLPWNVPGDLKIFKEYTSDNIVVMSEATFRSLPFSLPGRYSIVLGDSECYAKNGDEPDVILSSKTDLRDLCEFLDSVSDKDICIVGGRSLLDEASYFVERASITFVKSDLVGECDIFIRFDNLIDRLNSRLVVLSNQDYEFGHVVEWY